jgi:hypothetical protein
MQTGSAGAIVRVATDEPWRQLLRREQPALRGRQLDRQRQAIQMDADRGDR